MIPDRIGNIRMVFPKGKTLMLEDLTQAGTPAGLSVILSFSVNYCFLLSFPRPPGRHDKTPEILHTFALPRNNPLTPERPDYPLSIFVSGSQASPCRL